MYLVDQIIIRESRHKVFFDYCKTFSQKANNLYNAIRFRQRQIFCGWDKEHRTANEEEVFREVDILREARPDIRISRNISYRAMDALLRENHNPDYFAGLPMQSAQNTAREAVADFSNWLASLKKYGKDPSGYTGRPKMPKYGNPGGMHTYTITNQDAVLYPRTDSETGEYLGMELKLPLLKERLFLKHLAPDTKLKQVKVKPYHGAFILSLTLEVPDPEISTKERPNTAAVDFGSDNIAAIVSTDAHCAVFKGGAVLANNQLYAKQKALSSSIITKGHERNAAHSKKLDRMAFRHENFNRDQMHKISRAIVSYCEDHDVGTLVLGVNRQIKQKINIGKQNNQNFVAIPFETLRKMISYKAEMAGIQVIDQEESYTSRADITQQDRMPVYGDKDADLYVFSGTRVKRGLYRTGNGMMINADCNGAANILRKAIPSAWENCMDFGFLARPDSYGYTRLNNGYRKSS